MKGGLSLLIAGIYMGFSFAVLFGYEVGPKSIAFAALSGCATGWLALSRLERMG